jgi:hypothetical protein
MGGDIFCQHVKARFAIAKPLLATEREQPKPASTGKCTLDTKKQQFDGKIQVFAGHFRVNTGRVQSLQKPAFSRSFVQQMPGFIRHLPDFRAPKN